MAFISALRGDDPQFALTVMEAAEGVDGILEALAATRMNMPVRGRMPRPRGMRRPRKGFQVRARPNLPLPAIPPPHPTLTAPEVASGVKAEHVRPLARLLDTPLTKLSVLGRLWAETARPDDAGSLTLENSRGLFNLHRPRFWRAVRNNPEARRLFEDAGCTFDSTKGREGNAPFYKLRNGEKVTLSVDHMQERQENPSRALEPANLRLTFLKENTVLLNKLHRMDPFLRYPPGSVINR
jgi:hypothetical protein